MAQRHLLPVAPLAWPGHGELPDRCRRSSARSAHGGRHHVACGGPADLAAHSTGSPGDGGHHRWFGELPTRQPIGPVSVRVRCPGRRGAWGVDRRRRQALGSAGSDPGQDHLRPAVTRPDPLLGPRWVRVARVPYGLQRSPMVEKNRRSSALRLRQQSDASGRFGLWSRRSNSRSALWTIALSPEPLWDGGGMLWSNDVPTTEGHITHVVADPERSRERRLENRLQLHGHQRHR
jgi:hypothetical protein